MKINSMVREHDGHKYSFLNQNKEQGDSQEYRLAPDYLTATYDKLLKTTEEEVGRLVVISDDDECRKSFISLLTGGYYASKKIELIQSKYIELGKVITHNKNKLEIFGISVERRFLQKLERMAESLVGYILLIGTKKAYDKMSYLGYLMNTLRKNIEVPYVVAFDRSRDPRGKHVPFIQHALRLDEQEPFVEFDIHKIASVNRLLHELIPATTTMKMPKTQDRTREEAPPARLRSENLVKIYKKRKVVTGVSVELKQGEIVGLLGPNGAGKTTTFYMITGMVRANAGRIFIDDRDITTLPMYKRARLGIGYLSQEPSIFRRLTVEQNIMAILETMHLSKKERRNRLAELLEELNIAPLAKNKAYTLSGGERRRVEITRALVTKPKFMLLDEPFAGVDPIAVEEIQEIIQKLKLRGIGVLVTDHNVYETLSITDRAYLMYEGVVLKSGTAQFLASDPEAIKLYLGEKFRLDR